MLQKRDLHPNQIQSDGDTSSPLHRFSGHSRTARICEIARPAVCTNESHGARSWSKIPCYAATRLVISHFVRLWLNCPSMPEPTNTLIFFTWIRLESTQIAGKSAEHPSE